MEGGRERPTESLGLCEDGPTTAAEGHDGAFLPAPPTLSTSIYGGREGGREGR